ncbi:acyl-CoA thioesterase [Bowdeniella nasicola]|uniref:acyl-CoA thioesterase n=1 Tax=Bowdeniella nasicola TaxID=208480 RepID=UPI0009F92F27|nr:acyl-CoA thioesterase II [Bowdeniella nasicola]
MTDEIEPRLQPTPEGVPDPLNGVLPIPQPDVAPLSHVLAALDLTQLEDTMFAAPSLPFFLGRIYGGQVLSQAMMAAGRTTPDDGDGPRTLHSCHGYFLRPGRIDSALLFRVEILHDGRSFSTRRVHAIQHGKPILSVIASFQETQPGRDHQDQAPEVPDPETLPSVMELFEANPDPTAQFLARTGAFDIRHPAGDVFMEPAGTVEADQRVWMRARGTMAEGASQLLHRALLIYACDQVMLEPVLRRHSLSWGHEGISVASLDHSMWWHRDVDVSEWFLFEQHSPSAQGGRGLGTARIFDQSGRLVASAAQEGMVRVPEDTEG